MSKRRQSWASASAPGSSWASTLSDHIIRALSKASEAAATIPAVRVDVQLCPEGEAIDDVEATTDKNMLLSAFVLSNNGIFTVQFWQLKEAVMKYFELQEIDNEEQLTSVHLFAPDMSNSGKHIEIYDMAGLERVVSTFQAALKFRRPQIIRQRIKSAASILCDYVPDSSARPLEKGTEGETRVEIAMHEIWELAMMSSHHKRIFASKMGVVNHILDRLSCVDEDDIRPLHVTSAATLWALMFRPDSRKRLLSKSESSFQCIEKIVDAMIMARDLMRRKKPSKQKRREPVLTAFIAFCCGTLLAATQDRRGRHLLRKKLDDLRVLCIDASIVGGESLEGHHDSVPASEGVHSQTSFASKSSNAPLWPIPRRSLQDLLMFCITNCMINDASNESGEEAIKLWASRPEFIINEDDHNTVAGSLKKTPDEGKTDNKNIKNKSKKKKKKKKKNPVLGKDEMRVQRLYSSNQWCLSDLFHLIVPHTSMRARLSVASMLSTFARSRSGQKVLITNERIIGQIVEIGVWGIEWLCMVDSNDTDVRSHNCLRAPHLDEDETSALVYRILEHISLALWGWAQSTCNALIGGFNKGKNGDEEFNEQEIQQRLRSMEAMSSIANSISTPDNSRPGTKQSTRSSNKDSILGANLSVLTKPSAAQMAVKRVPGLITTLASISTGISLQILDPTLSDAAAISDAADAKEQRGGSSSPLSSKSVHRSHSRRSSSSDSIVSEKLEKDGSSSLQDLGSSSNVLKRIRSHGVEIDAIFGDEDAPPVYLPCLEIENNTQYAKTIEFCAAGCISTIAAVKQMAGAILKNGIVKILLKLLFSKGAEQRECRECAASALCTFAQGSYEGKKEIFDRGGMEMFLDALAPYDLIGIEKENSKSESDKDTETAKGDERHNFAECRASPKVIGFGAEVLHRISYLVEDAISDKVILQIVFALTSVTAPKEIENKSCKDDDLRLERAENSSLPAFGINTIEKASSHHEDKGNFTGQDPIYDWKLQTHIACTIWRLSTNQSNAIRLARAGVCKVIIDIALDLVQKGQQSTQDREQERVSLLEFLLLCLWLLSYPKENVGFMYDDRAIDLYIAILTKLPHENSFVHSSIVHEAKTSHFDPNVSSKLTAESLSKEEVEELAWNMGVSYSNLHSNAAQAAWIICEALPEISRQACNGGMIDGLRKLPTDKMVLGASVIQVLMRDKENLAFISQHYGEDFLEKMLIFMVTSGVPSLMRYGSLGCARVALTVAGRRRLVSLPGDVSSITHLLTLLRWTTCAATQVHVAQALLNMSKSKPIQLMIAKQGLYTLIEVSWSPLSEEARLVINGILFNIANNSSNRDRMYRAELHIKSIMQTGIKSQHLQKTLSRMPNHVQASLKAIGNRRSKMEEKKSNLNLPGQRASPLDSKGSKTVRRARRRAREQREKYNKWMEEVSKEVASFRAKDRRNRARSGSSSSALSATSSGNEMSEVHVEGQVTNQLDYLGNVEAEDSFSGVEVLFRGIKRKPEMQYLPQLSTIAPEPRFEMLPATGKHPSSISLSVLPGSTVWDPSTETNHTSALRSLNSMNNDDLQLDEDELPAAVEDLLHEKSLLGVSGVPLLGQCMRKPMQSMYSTIPPNSPLEPLATKVPRMWTSQQNLPPMLSTKAHRGGNHKQSMKPGTVDREEITHLGIQNEMTLQKCVERSFWARGPKNVKSLTPDSRKIVDWIDVKVAKSKGKDSENVPQKSFCWRLHGKAYYWRSMVQVTDTFGVQMVVTCQVLLCPDESPSPPLDLPEGIYDRLPPPPENATLPQSRPGPFQVPALGPPVPQKHILPVDEHSCNCGSCEPLDCGWRLITSKSVDQHARFSGYEGGDCGMFGRLRDRHMQFRVRLHRVIHEQEVEEEEEPEWIFHPRLVEADSKSYFDEASFPKMLNCDYERVISQEHFREFLKAKMVCTDEDLMSALDGCRAAFERPGVYQHVMHTFEFYSAMGNSSDMSQMLYNQCMDMLSDTDIVEPNNKKMDRAALDRIFIEANIEGDEQDEDDTGDTNADRALMRFEMIEMLMRIALQKFLAEGGGDGSCLNLPDAMTKLLDEHILINNGEGSCSAAIHDIDQFRRECLYTEEVDHLLRKHNRILRAIFEKFQDDENRRKKLPRMDFKHYMRFLKQVKVRKNY